MTFEATRRALHGVAELVLAGPQYERSGTIRLRVTPGGFGTVAEPDLRVDGDQLVTGGLRLPLKGTPAELADAAGIRARQLTDVYHDGSGFALDETLEIDEQSAKRIADAFARGEKALREFAPDQTPVLWPEHFDLGITLDEVNYGISPGDAHIAEPYAYVGPWTPRTGPFWNVSFGAAHPLSELDSIADFFREGRSS
ncbi:hypothetical protein Lesp02_73020 [Lentzea sp. NBRC 105346]|uniref:hypothetical protein n=1 Tax=Lentzea sp. NBRC 105346 TaxID=3032205 RepID=UPI0024A0D6C7|nr:hypothetical protein [Lentzea sp. NBRC 105346]GLZ35115.1 hypothetical protein Lesp02_73020 [Lentzea sp. NBRC 105346]